MVQILFEEASAPEPTEAAAGPTLLLTDAAAERVKEILAKDGRTGLYLRIRVDGGGCNGYSYNFMFDEHWQPDDVTIEKNGVTLLVDHASFNFLKGSTVDYVETLEASQFVVKNPNASSSCGCGNSFSV